MSRRRASDPVPEPVLIRVDRRTKVFLGALLLLLAVGATFKLHGSSVGRWNLSFHDRTPDAGVLLGEPKLIRIDEWAYVTPAIVSQANATPPFSAANSSWGPDRAPLILNLPVRHWSVLVRPQFWGFFVLDLERAFACYWNLKACLLLSGVFLLLMLLTRNDFGVSVFGAGWVFFSGFVQWWYSTPTMMPEMIGCIALAVVAVHYLVLSSRKASIVASALVLAVCLLDFVLSMYPPFQVPLFYLGIAIVAGSLAPHFASGPPRSHRALRIACAAVSLMLVAVLLALYVHDAKPAIDAIRNTAYPGSRRSSGGEATLAQVFGGFFGFFMSEASYPRAWFNVCEASNFVLLFPVPAFAVLWAAWRKRRVTALEGSLIAYLAIVLSWMTLGWPRVVAAASGFSLSQGTRSLVGLGLGSIILCCVFLSAARDDLPGGVRPKLVIGISALALFGPLALNFNRVTGGFATPAQVLIVILGAGLAGYLLLARRRIAFAACVLLPSLWSFTPVNPIAVGLGPILDTNVYRRVAALVHDDPGARWAVYGEYAFADYLKATGAQLFNGTKAVPPLEDLRVLDPAAVSSTIYNRYAHIALHPRSGPEVSFELLHADSYSITIDPNSELWRRLGVRYAVFPGETTNRRFLAQATLVLSLPEAGLWVYRYE